jgi:beta-N-acetylhexosaminidase
MQFSHTSRTRHYLLPFIAKQEDQGGAESPSPSVTATHPAVRPWPDGRDERDQHVVTSYNDCSVGEWDATYRKIWEWGIGAGLESIMVGHMMLPEYSRRLRPGISDADILPATFAPELLTDLLRDDLGFNGVVLTDASLMVGLTSALPRERQMVQAIAAGAT